MDPYLEAPDIVPDFHHAYAAMIRDDLNHTLPPSDYARMEMRPELGILAEGDECEDGPRKRIIPDVLLLKYREGEAGGVALAELPRAVSRAVEFATLPAEPARHFFVEIRHSTRRHAWVTLIEILSPTNTRKGPDRDANAAKQREVLESVTNLIEIDLLRSGRRVLRTPELEDAVARLVPTPEYLVLVSRAWMRREPYWGYLAYPASLRECLPCIGIPLRPGDPEVPLDLETIFHRA